MNRIEAIFSSYAPVVIHFGKEKIEDRIKEMLSKVQLFFDASGVNKQIVRVSDELVAHAVMDYFADIMRLKSFHHINRVNEYKILSYELYWWLRRKPIQIVSTCEDDSVFINEKFALSTVASFFEEELNCTPVDDETTNAFFDSLYYYFKFRTITAQDIEMILLAYKAGAHAGVCKGPENE